MIGRLRGTLAELAQTLAVIDAGGVGYEVEVTTATAADLAAGARSAPVTLHTHLIAREDAQTLYGFANAGERDLFRALIKVAGVGPRLGMALLSTISPAEFSAALATGNVAAITRVPGIGRRTAERLVVELRDKAEALAASANGGPAQDPATEAVQALLALGYRDGEAAAAVAAAQQALAEQGAEAPGVEQIVHAALKNRATR